MNSSDGNRTQKLDYGVQEFAHLRPRLREDLEFNLQHFRGETSCVVEDRVRSKFFRIGLPEYRFIALLDGRTSISEALTSQAASLGDQAISVQEAAQIVRWLIDNELAFSSASRDLDWIGDRQDERRSQKVRKRLNLMFIKLPLFNPDRLLDDLMPLFRWMTGPMFAILWVGVVITGLYQVIAHWDRFTHSAQGYLGVSNWLWIFLIWTVLKIIHELFHGLICKKYQGEVYEAGVIMILFAPIGYVDATSSWRFASKWHRIYTAFAGMYIEFFIAGIAAWTWVLSEPGAVNFVAWNVVVVASITTLLFNANPLMKFDGYYLFADLLEIPNLYGEGQRFVKHVFRRYFLAVESSLPKRPLREQALIGIYGFAALVWRVLVVVTLLIIASTLFQGAGLIIALVSGSLLVLAPVGRFVGYLFSGTESERPSLVRFSLASLSLIAGMYLLFTEVEVSRTIDTPALVAYDELKTIRPNAAGFVEKIYVSDGSRVSVGDPLISLSNPELKAQIDGLDLQIQKHHLELNVSRVQGRSEETEILGKQLLDLTERRNDLAEISESLQIKSPISGTVMAPDLDVLYGRHVARGQALMEIGSVENKKLITLVEQRDIEAFRQHGGQTVGFYVDGRSAGHFEGRLTKIDPKASRDITHPELTALAGGPLGVVPDQGQVGGYLYAKPRFEATVELDDDEVNHLLAGELAMVRVKSETQALGSLWFDSVNQWVNNLMGRSGA